MKRSIDILKKHLHYNFEVEITEIDVILNAMEEYAQLKVEEYKNNLQKRTLPITLA
jgi:hypothetical protein